MVSEKVKCAYLIKRDIGLNRPTFANILKILGTVLRFFGTSEVLRLYWYLGSGWWDGGEIALVSRWGGRLGEQVPCRNSLDDTDNERWLGLWGEEEEYCWQHWLFDLDERHPAAHQRERIAEREGRPMHSHWPVLMIFKPERHPILLHGFLNGSSSPPQWFQPMISLVRVP